MKFVRRFEKTVAAITLSIMTIVTFVAAVNRFTFSIAMPWSEELTRFLVMWMTMVGAALGVGKNEHVGIDVFVTRFPKHLQHVIALIMHAMGVVFSILFFYIGIQMVENQYMQTSTAMEISMGLVYACVVVGAVLMFIEFGYKFVHEFRHPSYQKGGDEA